MADDLEQVEELCGALLRKLETSERRRLLRSMARHLQKSQRARIASGRAPDGSAFAKRKEKKEPKPGAYAVKFLYHTGAARRLVFMKSWVHEGPLITGFDIHAGAIRSFFANKITEWLPVEAKDQNKSAGRVPKRRGAIRQRAMFRKLKLGRNLKAGADDRELWAGFTGRAAAIANVHQYGDMDRPAKKAKPVRYAKRQLLGWTSAERSEMVDLVLEHVASAD